MPFMGVQSGQTPNPVPAPVPAVTRKPRKSNPLRRIAPFAVLAAALSFSAWSLYFVARHLGAPVPVAVVVSTIFDGGAIFLADLGADHTREGDSGFGPRAAVFILAGLSAWLNALHARYGDYPESSVILWAAPPIVAVIVYEFTVRFIHRRSLRASGRIPSPLPQFDMASWLLFPVKTLKSMRRIVEFRREVTTALATGEPLPNNSGNPGSVSANPRTVPVNSPYIGVNPADVRQWARARGLPVGLKGPIPLDIYRQYRRAVTPGEPAAIGQGDGQGEPGPEYQTEFARSLGEFDGGQGEPGGDGDGGQGEPDGGPGGNGRETIINGRKWRVV